MSCHRSRPRLKATLQSTQSRKDAMSRRLRHEDYVWDPALKSLGSNVDVLCAKKMTAICFMGCVCSCPSLLRHCGVQNLQHGDDMTISLPRDLKCTRYVDHVGKSALKSLETMNHVLYTEKTTSSNNMSFDRSHSLLITTLQST
jgi:hypothetical protein